MSIGRIFGSIDATPTNGDERRSGLPPKSYQELKSAVHRELLNRLDLEKLTTMQDQRAKNQMLGVIQELVAGLNTPLSGSERERLCREVLHEIFGLGPLEPLLQDPTINDILVNTHRHVYVERGGVLEKTNVVFKDEAHLARIIDKMVSTVGRRVDDHDGRTVRPQARILDRPQAEVIGEAAGNGRP